MKRLEVLVGDELAGHITLETRPNHGFESTTFEYAGTWLAEGFSLSPDLPLGAGPHFPSDGLNVFRAFTDAAPDAWGRRVLFASGALTEPLSSNSEIAMLLAVDDVTRQGALRFRLDGQFLTTGQGAAALRNVPDLLRAADRLQETGRIDPEDRVLMQAGTSAGGAQPKAWLSHHQSMWLAKFPAPESRHRQRPRWDTGIWELTATEIQRRCGVSTMPSGLLGLGAAEQRGRSHAQFRSSARAGRLAPGPEFRRQSTRGTGGLRDAADARR